MQGNRNSEQCERDLSFCGMHGVKANPLKDAC